MYLVNVSFRLNYIKATSCQVGPFIADGSHRKLFSFIYLIKASLYDIQKMSIWWNIFETTVKIQCTISGK
jgi:hypothetical protein